MEKDPQHQQTDLEQLGKRISDLELRLSILEKRSASTGARGLITFGDSDETRDTPAQSSNNTQNESVESRVGEYGMAWLGNIVLLIGILFLTQLLLKNGQEALSLGLGIIAAAIFMEMQFKYKVVIGLLILIGTPVLISSIPDIQSP